MSRSQLFQWSLHAQPLGLSDRHHNAGRLPVATNRCLTLGPPRLLVSFGRYMSGPWIPDLLSGGITSGGRIKNYANSRGRCFG
jgi:hypothetical protein